MRFLWQGLLIFGLCIQQIRAADNELSVDFLPDPVSSAAAPFKGVDLCYTEFRKSQSSIDDSDDEQSGDDDPTLERGLIDIANLKVVVLEDNTQRKTSASSGDTTETLMEATDLFLTLETQYSALSCLNSPVRLNRLRNLGAGLLGLVGGVVTTTVATGVYRKTTRDLLRAPQETALGDVVVGVTAVALLPAFVGVFAKIGHKLCVGSKCCLLPSPQVLEAERKFMYPISKAHKSLDVFLGMVVGINSCTTLAQMVYLQLENVTREEKVLAYEFIGAAGIFYFLADFAMNFDNGQREVNHFLLSRIHPKNRVIRTLKSILTTRINIMKALLKSASQEQIQSRYRAIDSQMEEPWKTSWFLTEELAEVKAVRADLQWRRFAKDMEILEGASFQKKMADLTAKLLIIFGTWGRFETLVYGSNLMLEWFGVDPVTAFWGSCTLAGIGSIGKALWEADLHHRFMRTLFCCAGPHISPDNFCVQTITMSTAVVSAVFVAIAGISLGMKALDERYPIGAQVLLLGSAAVLNFSAYASSLGRRALFSIRPIARQFLSEVNKNREELINKCCQLEGIVERLTDNATRSLYNLLGSRARES